MFKYTAYFNSFVSLLLGFFVYFNGPTKKQNIFLFFLSLSISFYAIFFALSIYEPRIGLSLFEVKLFHIFCCFIATFLYLFTNEIIFADTFSRFWHLIPFLSSGITSYYLLTGNVIRGVERIGSLPNWTIPGSQFFLYLFHYGFFTTVAITLLIVYYFKRTGIQQNQIKLILIGAGLALFGGWTTFLPGWGIKVEPYGIHFIFVFQFVLAYTILKYQLMNIKATLSKMGALIVSAIIYGLGYFFLAYFYTTVLRITPKSYVFIAISLSYGLATGLYFNRTRLFLQTKAERIFIKGWYDYRQVLRKVASSIARALTREDVVKTIFPIFHDDIDISEVNIYFFNELTGDYVERDPEAGEFKSRKPLSKDAPLIEQILAKRGIVAIDGKISVPCFSGDELIALFIFGKKCSEDEFTSDDLELFKTISDYVAIALEYIVKPYEEVKAKFEVTQSKLAEAEKNLERAQRLSSLGRVVAEVAHEIRNPLTVISSRAQKIKRKNSDPAYVLESADLMLQKCDEIKKVTAKMYTLDQPQKYELAEVDIGEAINKAIEAMPSANGIKIIKELNAATPVMGDQNDLTRVFINLFTNAYDAMRGKGGTLTIETQNEENKIKIVISDTGSGISKEALPEVFEPFFTTKFGKIDERMGFGLTICHDIIYDKHHGTINVESTPGKGTKFTILLPAKA